jgi:hypothetical protein
MTAIPLTNRRIVTVTLLNANLTTRTCEAFNPAILVRRTVLAQASHAGAIP